VYIHNLKIQFVGGIQILDCGLKNDSFRKRATSYVVSDLLVLFQPGYVDVHTQSEDRNC